MKDLSPLNKPLVHFIGVGGIGISALAQWFLAQKWAISGSDMQDSDLVRNLQKKGLKFKIGHKKTNIGTKTALVVYNQAIPASNPELREARRRNIPTLTYPQILGALTRNYKTVAIAGAHGKSTTTALTSLVMIGAGFDPTVIVGTLLKEFGDSNFRNGKSDWLLIEADEFKMSFHNYSPTYAVITNIDKEHLDVYKNLANVKKSFLKFIGNIKAGGILVANRDDKNLFGLKSRIQKICKKQSIRLIWYRGGILKYTTPLRRIKKVLKITGQHNVSNALAVYTLARALGIKEKTILKALSGYRGAWRRMEYRGQFKIQNSKFKIPVYDDYAHHPTEIKATLQAFHEKFPESDIVCVFQPHQAHRLKNLFKEFTSAFDLADYLILLPIYQVAGRDKTHRGYTSADLAKKIKNRGKENIYYLPNPNNLCKFIKKTLNPTSYTLSPVIVMMGAGNIVNYTASLIK
ncbi:MAG TPA: UDP-N-acetylmuramate--L-alanine ligase [Candidatus Paceibacterota bacterium]|nr:UDP-N-acetylmuramate--L-alanine ligase [Candidatus Paceibacterota bacterium]